jgi:hypothetical protein
MVNVMGAQYHVSSDAMLIPRACVDVARSHEMHSAGLVCPTHHPFPLHMATWRPVREDTTCGG